MDLNAFIDAALEEDIKTGDVTANACIIGKVDGKAKLIAKEKGIISGLKYIAPILHKLDPNAEIVLHKKDGNVVQEKDLIAELQGDGKALLSAERLILNIMQRMSGIASHTYLLQSLINHTKAKVLDTRKTTPLFRSFEKEAVLHGGGANHRIGLYDMILIKENHIELAGGIENAIRKARNYRLSKDRVELKIEIEVENLEEVKQCLICGGIDRIMLDNFSTEDMKEAVELVKNRFEIEASGGITAERIAEVAETGVDFISVGALTHSSPSLDISMLTELSTS